MSRIDSLTWLVGFPCLLALVTWRTVSWPYTKVEESFTIQAVHDILSYGVSPAALERFDHQVFPGAVPRSFVGPLALAAVSYPLLRLCRAVGAVQTSADVQVVVRLCLGAANAAASAFFAQACFASANDAKNTRGSVSLSALRQLGFFFAITATQFHFGFWVSRTIPNSIALPFVMIALALICRNLDLAFERSQRSSRDIRIALWLLTFSAVVLRSEIAATIIPVGLYLLVTGKIGLLGAIKTGLAAATFSVAVTTFIDTYFWQNLQQGSAQGILGAFTTAASGALRGQGPPPLWPELNALVFNVVDGKSSEWGVSPWHAYVTALLPRLLVFSEPLLLYGAIEAISARPSALMIRAKFLLLTAGCHMAVLSCLGHKEWRFILYVVPALNAVSAGGAEMLTRSAVRKVALVTLLALQIGLSWLSGYLSAINYPGGQALDLLHRQLALEPSTGPVIVHIDVAAAMTGVSLFESLNMPRDRSNGLVDRFAGVVPSNCETHGCWMYDKTEDLPVVGPQAAEAWSKFTHLLEYSRECRVLLSSSDATATPLPDDEQPFEPLTPPVTMFAGFRRKTVAHILRDLASAPRAIVSALLGSSQGNSQPSPMRLLLPLDILEEPAIWLCRRKDVN